MQMAFATSGGSNHGSENMSTIICNANMASAHRKRLIIIFTFRFYEKKRIHVNRKNIVGDELSTGTDILSLPSRRMYNECNYLLL